MKRLVRACLLSIAIVLLAATIAPASTLYVTPSTSRHTVAGVSHLDIRGRMSRASTIRVRIYRSGTLVRTLAPSTYAQYVAAHWNLKNRYGAYVKAGTYTCLLTATSGGSSTTVRSSVYVSQSLLPAPAKVDRLFGLYRKGAPTSMQPITDFATQTGVKADIVNFYVALNEGFPASRVATVQASGAIPLVTLEFWNPAYGVNQPSWNLASITNGYHDAQIRAFARGAKAAGTVVWVRPLHEMNSNWYPWAGAANGNRPANFVPAWRHIVNVMRAEGATNIRFVWCPNNDTVGSVTGNTIPTYWPGDAYVDRVALDGYNFGTSFSWSRWRSFTDTFRSSYAAVAALTTKPIFIAETGCSATGGDKAAWVTNMFKVIPSSFARITAVVWFDSKSTADFRVNSDLATLASFRAALPTF